MQPAMTGNDLAGILDAETPFHRGFKEIAELRRNRKHRAPAAASGPVWPRPKRRKAGGDRKARDKTADRPRPGLLGTDPRPEFWSADAAAGEIAADIGHPHHQQDQHQRGKAVRSDRGAPAPTQPCGGGIGKSRRRPDAASGASNATAARPIASTTSAASIRPDGETNPGQTARAAIPDADHARYRARRRRSSAIRHRGRSRPASPARPTAIRRHRRWRWQPAQAPMRRARASRDCANRPARR